MWKGIDPGNYETKLVTAKGCFKFLSTLGEWRDFNIESAFQEDDMSWEYEGQKGFAGTLAYHESRFHRVMAGDTKAHVDAKISILLALHRFGEPHNFIVTGQPIKSHKKDKEKIIHMLEGKHVFTLNGVTKTIYIDKVAVAPEGAGAYWCYRGTEEQVKVIDVGSGTVNAASIHQGRYVDRDSFTLSYGANSQETYQVEDLAKSIITYSSKKDWKPQDFILVCGGITDAILPYLKEYFPRAKALLPMIKSGSSFRSVHPVFANAAGYYELGCALDET